MASSKRPMFSFESSGNTKYVDGFFKRTKQRNFTKMLEYYAGIGVEALALETPVDTGETALSWSYEIEENDGSISLYFTNSAMSDSWDAVPVVLLIEYGHATRNGGYVAPYDFVNPVTKELMEHLAETIWEEVTRK